MSSSFSRLTARIRAFFSAQALDSDLDQELESHAAMLAEENMRAGMSHEDARRAARIRLGATESTKQQHREERGLPFLDTLSQDLRYSIRTLRKDLGFALFAILIVGLGIGASCTIFSVVNALLLRPLPFKDPAALVWMQNGTSEAEDLSGQTTQVDYVRDMRRLSPSWKSIGAYMPFYGIGDTLLLGTSKPVRLTNVGVTDNFFDLLGVNMIAGRNFNAQEAAGKNKVIIVSYNFWKTRAGRESECDWQHAALRRRGEPDHRRAPSLFRLRKYFRAGHEGRSLLRVPARRQHEQVGKHPRSDRSLEPRCTARSGAVRDRSIVRAPREGKCEDAQRLRALSRPAPRAHQRRRAARRDFARVRGGSGDADRLREPFEFASRPRRHTQERNRDSLRAWRHARPPNSPDAHRIDRAVFVRCRGGITFCLHRHARPRAVERRFHSTARQCERRHESSRLHHRLRAAHWDFLRLGSRAARAAHAPQRRSCRTPIAAPAPGNSMRGCATRLSFPRLRSPV